MFNLLILNIVWKAPFFLLYTEGQEVALYGVWERGFFFASIAFLSISWIIYRIISYILVISKLSSDGNKSGYQYYSECWLESSEFIHKLTFAIYEKKQKVFQLPSLFVSLCYYISAAVDEKANILVQLAERFRSSLISLFSQYFIVEH